MTIKVSTPFGVATVHRGRWVTSNAALLALLEDFIERGTDLEMALQAVKEFGGRVALRPLDKAS